LVPFFFNYFPQENLYFFLFQKKMVVLFYFGIVFGWLIAVINFHASTQTDENLACINV
jgi:membrane associated rhomboid family serine protease